MRCAIFRALRRGSSAAYLQHGNRRGALFHRSGGASSQAIRRGPAVSRSGRPQAMYGQPFLQAECFERHIRAAPMYPASALWAWCQDGDSRARLLTRYSTSKGPQPADRFAERRSTVGPSLCTSSRRVHAAKQLPGLPRSAKLVAPSRPSRLHRGTGLTSRPGRSGPVCWRAQRRPRCAWRAAAALLATRRAACPFAPDLAVPLARHGSTARACRCYRAYLSPSAAACRRS